MNLVCEIPHNLSRTASNIIKYTNNANEPSVKKIRFNNSVLHRVSCLKNKQSGITYLEHK